MSNSTLTSKDILFKVIESLSTLCRKFDISETEFLDYVKNCNSKKAEIPEGYSIAHNTLYRLIGKWRGDPAYSEGGNPNPLKLEDGSNSFKDLVSSIDQETDFRKILNALLETGAADYSIAEGTIALINNKYLPFYDHVELVKILQKDTCDLVSTVVRNLSCNQNSTLHQLRTEYDKIPAAHEDEIRHWISNKASEVHSEISSYLAKFDADCSNVSASGPDSEYITVSFSSFNGVNKKS